MKQRIEKVKVHLRENKKTYVAVGITTITAVAGTWLIVRDKGVVAQKVSNLGIVNWKPTNTLTQTTVLVRRGHPGNVIRCDQTGEVFASQNRAAEALGISPSNLSQHLQGRQASVSGYTFENLGEATQAS